MFMKSLRARSGFVVVLVCSLVVGVLSVSQLALSGSVKIIEDFSDFQDKPPTGLQRWNAKRVPDRIVEEDREVYHSAPASMRVTGSPFSDVAARFLIFIGEEYSNFLGYNRLTVMIYPSKELSTDAFAIRFSKEEGGDVGTRLTDIIPAARPGTLPANTWTQVVFDISDVPADVLGKVEVIELFINRDRSGPYELRFDTVALENQ